MILIHKSTKLITAVSILFFVACITVSGAFLDRVAKQKEVYETKTMDRRSMIEREKGIVTLTEELEATKEERAFVASRILREDDVIDFLALIEGVGREQDVALQTSSLKVESIDTMFEALVVSIDITGTYDAVVHMVTLFEYLPYQVSLGKLRIRNESENENNWTASFEIRVTKFKKV
jgi:Tfp pilus assembly protein PilO